MLLSGTRELKVTRELLVQSCAALGQCQREGTYYLFSQGAQRHHLLARLCTCKTACICLEGWMLFSIRHKELHRLPWLCAMGGFWKMKDGKKEENKGRLGPQQPCGEAQAAGAIYELLCDIPCLYHKERGPALSSLHKHKPAFRSLC